MLCQIVKAYLLLWQNVLTSVNNNSFTDLAKLIDFNLARKNIALK